MRTVTVLPYDDSWPAAFETARGELEDVLGPAVKAVHHIGSTSVPGLSAKPVIDILVESSSLTSVDAASSEVEALGYEARGEHGIPGRRYFSRPADCGLEVHVHVFESGSPHLRRHLMFRDHLRAQPTLAAEYSRLKEALAGRFATDPESYQAGKAEFIRRITSGTPTPERETPMSDPKPIVRDSNSADLPDDDLSDIRHLMDAAFGARFSEADWHHALGGRHFFIRGGDGAIVSHVAVVPRTLEAAGHRLTTGYVEAVATHPESRRKGLATLLMRAAAELIDERFQLGALSGDAGFYQRLGWIRWRGATWCRHRGSLRRTADDDGGVLVLPVRSTPSLDFESDIVADWREGDVW